MAKSVRKIVGIRITDWAGYIRELYQGIIDFSQSVGGWQLRTYIPSDWEIEPVEIDSNWEGDGLITFRCSPEEAKAFRTKGIPVVNLSREGNIKSIPYVGPDNQQVGILAADHLLGLGLKQFAVWTDPTRRYSRERCGSFINRINEAGYEVQVLSERISEIPPGPGKWRAIQDLMQKQLALLKTPTGLFAKDDLSATTLMEVCAKMNWRVPEDVAILGFGGDPIMGCVTNPPMSSIQHPTRLTGLEAARMLHQMMLLPDKDYSDVLVPVSSIVQRGSTDILGFEDPVFVAALSIIRKEAPGKMLRIQDLSKRLGISRTTLLNLFRKHLQRSPKQEIQRVRLKELKHHLLVTDGSIKEISFKMGFSSPEDLCRFFQTQVGTSPKDFRQKERLVFQSAREITIL